MEMAKSFCAVLALLTMNMTNFVVMGQSTVGDRINDEHDSMYYMYCKDELFAFEKTIQSELQILRAEILRLEHRTYHQVKYCNCSMEEVSQILQTDNTDAIAQISRLENGIERLKAYIIMNSSIQENKSQIQTDNIDTKAKILSLENGVEHLKIYLNNSLLENKRQMLTESTDRRAEISSVGNSIERLRIHINNSLQETERKMQTENIDIKAEISHLENLIKRHSRNINDSIVEIKREIRMQNMELKKEFQELIQTQGSLRCPNGFNYSVAGFTKCYAVLTDRVTWDAAQQKCQQLHTRGQLAVIISSIEVQIMNEVLQYHDCYVPNQSPGGAAYPFNEFWIGARRRNVSDCSSPIEWTSNSGAMFSMQYNNWGPTEPNCHQRREACASINKNIHSKWNDLPCSWSACPLCEITIRT